MFRRLLFLAFAFFLYPSLTYAQTHPCDAAAPLPPSITSPFGIGLCASSKDLNGQPTTYTNMIVAVDGQTVFSGLLQPIGAPNSAGQSYYETPKTITVPAGNHSVTATLVSAAGTTPSNPLVFTTVLLPAAPSPATLLRIVK